MGIRQANGPKFAPKYYSGTAEVGMARLSTPRYYAHDDVPLVLANNISQGI